MNLGRVVKAFLSAKQKNLLPLNMMVNNGN